MDGPNLGSLDRIDRSQKDSDATVTQGRYRPLLEDRSLELGQKHPQKTESMNNLIALYEAWNKPEKANEWRKKLPQKEAVTE